ncbi:MAG: choice-of-anchor E domain-containing protein [Chitinophagaceae bacterium]
MKTVFFILPCLLLGIIFPSPVFSQCAGGTGPFTLKYDITLYGTGSAAYAFSFPKFDIPMGTLLSANVKSAVNLGYSYVISNGSAATQTYKVRITRSDDINCSAIDPLTINGVKQTVFAPFVLAPAQEVSYGPAYLGYTVSDSITTINPNLNNFQGVGTVDFDYQTTTSAVTALPAPGFNFSSIEIFDTVHASISYLYCLASVLPTDLLDFTAVPQSKNNVLLNWRQLAVEAGRRYGIQVSTDGIAFTTVAYTTENTTGLYSYTYLNSSTAKKLYFRLQQKNISGALKYSEIRLVSFNEDRPGGVSVYPTLLNNGDLHVNFPEKGDWQVNIYAADGKKIAASRHNNTAVTSLQIPGQAGNGLYVVETFNVHSQQRQVTRIIVQR